MMRLTLTIALSLLASIAFSANVFTVDDSGNVTASGIWTNASGVEVNGDVTLANDETIDNATDGDVTVTFDDDSTTLGQFYLKSENAAGNMADEDHLDLVFTAKDDNGDTEEWLKIEVELDDVTFDSEDATVKFWLQDAGAQLPVLQLVGSQLLLANNEGLDNAVDGTLEIGMFDEDTVELGNARIRSENAGTADADYFTFSFAAQDSGAALQEFGDIRLTLDDITDGTEDGTFRIRPMVGGTLTTIGLFDSSGAAITGVTDSDSFTSDAAAGLDTQSAGALLLGAATATSVEIADAGVTTDIQGPVTVLGTTGAGIDTAGATAMYIAEATATSLNLGASDIDTISLGRLTVLEGAGEGLDSTGAGILEIGAANATSVVIADSGVDTKIEGGTSFGVQVNLNTTATVTLTADHNPQTGVYGHRYYNDDNDVIQYTLPAVAAGMHVTIGNSDVGASSVITIEIDGSDFIVLDGVKLDAGDTIDSPATAGATITLIGLDSSRWITEDRIGTWVDGGAT